MKALLDNLLSIIKKKSPKELKNMLTSTNDPDNVIIYMKTTKNGIIGNYTIDTKVPILFLDEKSNNNSDCNLSNSLNIKQLIQLLDQGSIKIEDITTKKT